ncbi:uncharacterized protein L203_104421 [Cryptococcus depauperatus CBS 7841]|uniref:Uncharacterized protein n=1 Tax=Cryptococcus depauperatus CBS 7841 TaxID=1295531 RepID=A0A1E3IIP9_9TREE|nr:hypothetical protein L203_03359 [Cryptococcus depauperatus CBS 7841]
MPINVTYDDFDPLVVYSDYSQWWTPNPQDHPDWYNATADVTSVPWHEATIHYTTTPGANFSFNFSSTSAWIYGAAGTTTTNYTIVLDGVSSSHSATNSSNGRTLLWSASGLNQGAHNVVLKNDGSGIGVDAVVIEYDIGGNPSNTTIDNTDSSITYSGNWESNNGAFYGGTSSYTKGFDNKFSFNFTGSALYIFGDQVNDHGLFSIYFNKSSIPFSTLSGRSGCGTPNGKIEKTCEKLGTLKAFVGGLGQGEHMVEVVNGGAEGTRTEATFFDFDYLVYSQPSSYPSFTIDPMCSNGICSSSTLTTGTATSATSAASGTNGSGKASGAERLTPGLGVIMWMGIVGAWMGKKLWIR